MLSTNLTHLENRSDIDAALENYENVMICCGRMGPMCIPVYRAMEELESGYSHVAFRDLAFDSPAADFVKQLPQCQNFMGLPFTVYFKNGKAVAATSSIQNKAQIREILDREFSRPKA